MIRMSHTAGPFPGGILYRNRMVRSGSAVAAVLLALSGVLWSATTHAGRSSASFGITVRVLPHCDESRLGGLSETPNGRMVCVYPKIRQWQADPDMQRNAGGAPGNEHNDTDSSHVIRTIQY